MGYRAMTRCLRTRYNLKVSRDTVMRLLKEIRSLKRQIFKFLELQLEESLSQRNNI